MADVVEKMCRAFYTAATELAKERAWDDFLSDDEREETRIGMLAALDALAESVTPEMIEALTAEARFRLIGEESNADYHRRAIRAAILAAKGFSAPTPDNAKDVTLYGG